MATKLTGKGFKSEPVQKDAKKPAAGTHRVEYTRHYGNYQKGDRSPQSHRSCDIESKRPAHLQRFKIVARGPKAPDTPKAGGRREVDLD